MTPLQIEKLLERVQETASKIASDLEEVLKIDAPISELHALGRRAAKMVEELRAVGEKIRARSELAAGIADELSGAADTADSLADELDTVGTQLLEFVLSDDE